MNIFDILEKISDILAQITIKIVIVLAGLMTLTVLVGVFFRYVLGNPLGWTEALARYIMIWTALLAVSVCIKDRENVRLEIIVSKLPKNAARILAVITDLVVIVFLAEITRRGYNMAVSGFAQQSLALGISMFLPLLSVPVSMGLALIQQIIRLILNFRPKVSKEDLFGEHKKA